MKPEVARHELLFQLERETGLPMRFAWVMLPTICDREGRFKWRPLSLKPDVLPYDDCNFADVLDALLRAEMLVRYEVAGEAYGCIPTFVKHQRINAREPGSQYPQPPEPVGLINGTCAHVSEHVYAHVEGKGREGKRKGTGSTVAAQIGIAFLEFPVIGTAPGPYVLSEEQVTEWTTLFPGLNVRQEAQKALAWVRANSGRKKTLSGMPRFLVNWLSRATDTSHPSAGSSQLLTRRNQTTLGAAARILQGGE